MIKRRCTVYDALCVSPEKCARESERFGMATCCAGDVQDAACTHGNGQPSACSQCIGAVPRRVVQQGGMVQAEGDEARPVELVVSERVRRTSAFVGREAARRRRQG